MKPQQSVQQWRALHDGGYIDQTLPTYSIVRDYLREYVGLHEGDRVLEIGCGYGALMYDVADHVAEVVGVDIHDAPLAAARRVLQAKPNASVHLCDGVVLPFDAGGFTMVYSCSVLQHIPRAMVPGFIAEARRVLCVGGRACLQVLKAGEGQTTNDVDVAKIKEQSIGWTPSDFLAAASGAAFEVTARANHGRNLFLIGVAK